MDEIYVEQFAACKNTYDDDRDTRNKVLNRVNNFFNTKTGYRVLNIIEEWSEDKSTLRLIVYYY